MEQHKRTIEKVRDMALGRGYEISQGSRNSWKLLRHDEKIKIEYFPDWNGLIKGRVFIQAKKAWEPGDTAPALEDLLAEEGYEVIANRDPKFYIKKSEARSRIAHREFYAEGRDGRPDYLGQSHTGK